MDTIESVLSSADRAWRAYGVGSADRAALAADLRADLEAAAAEGAGPEQLIGPDVAGFARRLADEAGVTRSAAEFQRLFGTALVGGALGAVAGYAVYAALYPFFVRVMDIPQTIDVPVQVAVGVYYGVPAALVIVGAVLTVRLRLRDLARIERTAWTIAWLWAVTGLLITPVVMGFAWTTDYSLDTVVVFTEVAIVVAALAGATYLARRWALRERPTTAARTPQRTSPA
ncbi:hypothetical protein OHA21_25665 [Actinoplanes sp. NBC_00393]|uniref:hypothetical protein n=1 Tax=Actinoplanes sp. NBC_00393 TaxID=2975953 RepID=UPI002E1E2D1F